MKKLNPTLKLQLKKTTISELDKNKLTTIKGGGSQGGCVRSRYMTSCQVH